MAGKGQGWEGWTTVLSKVAGLSLLGGPATAAVWAVWKRDEIVLGAGDDADEKVRKVK